MDLVVIDYNIEEITTYGHPNVRAFHHTTFEITTDDYLTYSGDCIIGIKADKSAGTLSEKTKRLLRNDNAYIFILLKSGDLYDFILARGSSKLQLTNKRSMVFRKSSFIDDRTVAIGANKAAYDINRDLIKKLVEGDRLKVFLMVVLFSKR